MDQLNLFESPTAVQVDENHWEIYTGNKIAGYFEVNEIGWDFKTVRGPLIGAGGPLAKGESFEIYLNNAINACTTRRR